MAETVLLVNPPIYDFAAYDYFNKPLGLLYLAAFLRQAGYNVRLIDALDRRWQDLTCRFPARPVNANGTAKYHSEVIATPALLRRVPLHYRRYGLPEDLFAQALAEAVAEEPPAAVLVTSMMTYWYPAVVDTVKLIRKVVPAVPVALGGVYARLMPDHAQRVCQPDWLYTGGSLLTVLKWLDSLTGRSSCYGDLDDNFLTWPAPAYELYPQLDYLTVITSVGCPFRCDYCAGSRLQHQLLQLTADGFLAQLQGLIPLLNNSPGGLNIAFMDDALLAGPEQRMIDILQGCRRLNLPLRFHCPNGLHARFITERIAELMYVNNFSTVRISYEACDSSRRWQQASDHKVSDKDFKNAVRFLVGAGYKAAQLDAYILVNLPGQTISEVEQSARAAGDLGLKVRLCQYSPIPGTRLFDLACRWYGIDPAEPLLHNNTVLPALDKAMGWETFQQFKNHILQLNHALVVNRSPE